MNSSPPVSRARPLLRILVHFGIGMLLGLFFHYLLYRIYLPVEPFIYVAF